MADRLPEEGELVVVGVTTVKNYGAFVSLDEYNQREGFIHIAEVSTGWVKYIRNYVREGQKIVCKVLRVDSEKGYVDLSLKQVNEHQRRDKIRAWKNETRAKKLLEFVAERSGKEIEWCYDTFAYDLMDTYGSLYGAFEECAIYSDTLKEEGFKGVWVKHFLEAAADNIIPPFVQIFGILEVTSDMPNGIEYVKNTLLAARKKEDDDIIHLEIKSLGTPKYAVRVRAEEYKAAEEELKNAYERARTEMGENGSVEFKRKEHVK